jgi:hypothetical protein
MRFTPSNSPQSNTHAPSSNLPYHHHESLAFPTYQDILHLSAPHLVAICACSSSSTFTAAFQLRADEYAPNRRLNVVVCGGATQ